MRHSRRAEADKPFPDKAENVEQAVPNDEK